jgi:hypothetical protein
MALATQMVQGPQSLVDSIQASIRALKQQGCICIHSVYGMTQDDFEKSATLS